MTATKARMFPRGFLAVLAGAGMVWALVIVALYIRFVNSPVTSYYVIDGQVTDREMGFLGHYLAEILLLGMLLAVVAIIVGAVMGSRSRVNPGTHPQGGATSASLAGGVSAAPAGWNPDPHGGHELRYWDGTQWTEHVADHGRTSVDTSGVDPASGTGVSSGG